MAKKTPPADEVDELDRAYVSITGYKPKRLRKEKKKRKAPLIICIAALLVIVLAAAAFLTVRYTTLFDGVLKMGQVTIAGVSVGGMTKTDAKLFLKEYADKTYRAQPMVIQVLDTTVTLSPEDTGIDPDTDKAVDIAFREGAEGTFDLMPYLSLDLDVIQAAVNTLGTQYNTELSPSTAAVTGSKPSLEADSDPNESEMVLSITIGSPEYGLDTDALYQQILQAYCSGTLQITGVCRELEPEMPDLEALYNQTYVAPIDAQMDPTTFEVSQNYYGLHFDLEAAKAAVADAGYGESLEIPFVKIPAAVTAADLSSKLFCDVLGSAQTPYSGRDTNNRNTNLMLACEAINGLVLLPGESFSYNETLGERTAEAGYKEAASYVGGLTVDTLGGGICQISSTLYYSTLFADLEILERHNHGYVSDYIPKGMDATVTWDGADFRFSNNTHYPIRIEAWRADGKVNVQIIGTEERDYYIKMTYKVIESTPYDTVYEEMSADNPKGYKDGDVIVTPYTGYIVKAYKEKYSRATDEKLSSEMESYNVYKKRDKVICRIVESPAPEETPTE